MLRLTLMLSVAIYALLVIFSETAPEAADVAGPAAPPASDTGGARAAGDHLATSTGERLAVAAVITSSDIRVASGTEVAIFATPSGQMPGPGRVSAPAGRAAVFPVVEVTGNQVNLHRGPSTADAVVTALVAGTQAELIGMSGDGWALIRAVDTGVEGYMSDRFLAVLD